ncbi:hypothetical protein ACVIGB_008559 [Bradyrhizobium sp. USDA 4341]
MKEELMAVRQLASLTLSDEERAELKSLTTGRKTAQLRARIVLTCAEGGQNKEVAAKPGLGRSTSGGGALWSGAWTGCMTRPAPGRHVRLTMSASKP